jgi:hypothetical protein
MKITLKHKALALMVASALLAGSSAALAAKPTNPGGGGGGGGGGGNPGGEETAAQNLSVPTIMVGTPPGGLSCGTEQLAPTALRAPTGTPLSGYTGPADSTLDPADYYWVQKVHTWQAQCFQAGGASVWGNWGDNLEGDAKLKVGSPIRVELVLTNETAYPNLTPLQGYTVIKLEDKLDRESAYGHLAVAEDASWVAVPINFPDITDDPLLQNWLVHDAGITFSVQNLATLTYAVPPGTSPTAEINATGKVVYGYNLRVGVAGPYRITFTSSPLVEFLGQDAVNGALVDANTVSIDINVVAGGGGGGGGGKPR